MKEFKVDKHITLRLTGIKHKKTIIIVDDEEFMQCKYLLIVNPQEKRNLKEIRSIDEAGELLSGELERELKPGDLGITPDEEFWGHCSNLQAWVENDYNINIIHTNLAFPLLKKIAEKGSKKAREKLREVVIEILEGKNLIKIKHMLEEDYFKFFSWEEFKDLYRIFSDTSKIGKSKMSIKEIRIYVELFSDFSACSRNYSNNYEYLLKPIIPDIRDFLKKLNIKKERPEEILNRRFFVDRRYITLKELLKEN
ncbi:hypothetical protein LCGC14_1413870 [marine sediment metagenome]|uniref:Uncharacterized protein n=1 Tax=marine sediment metagenome TaxID=412755 RepID=A0A0F9MV41_9ZZZZ